MNCPTKRECYPSQKSANAHLASFRKKSRRLNGKRRKVPNRSYLCHVCHQWHLTSVERKDRHQWKGERRS